MSTDQPRWGEPDQQPSGPTEGSTPAMAMISVVTGIFGLLASFFCLIGVVPAVIAVITGVLARNEITASGGELSGQRAALTGIVTGAVAIVITVVLIVLLSTGVIEQPKV